MTTILLSILLFGLFVFALSLRMILFNEPEVRGTCASQTHYLNQKKNLVLIVEKKLSQVRNVLKRKKVVLVKSISGIRGTLENIPGKSLSDLDISKAILSYIKHVINKSSKNTVVIGRDARPSGDHINKLVIKIL